MTNFLLGLVRDPVSKDMSSARSLALVVGLAGVVFAFTHPADVQTVAALFAASAAFLFSRTKSAE